MKIYFGIFRFLFYFLGFIFCSAKLKKLPAPDRTEAQPSQAGPATRQRLPRPVPPPDSEESEPPPPPRPPPQVGAAAASLPLKTHPEAPREPQVAATAALASPAAAARAAVCRRPCRCCPAPPSRPAASQARRPSPASPELPRRRGNASIRRRPVFFKENRFVFLNSSRFFSVRRFFFLVFFLADVHPDVRFNERFSPVTYR